MTPVGYVKASALVRELLIGPFQVLLLRLHPLDAEPPSDAAVFGALYEPGPRRVLGDAAQKAPGLHVGDVTLKIDQHDQHSLKSVGNQMKYDEI